MRDKVKRFLSILMTALMLVNLLPVGALAEGVMISNSVQSRASETQTLQTDKRHVYVYARVPDATDEQKKEWQLNADKWYFIGICTLDFDMPNGILTKQKWGNDWYTSTNGVYDECYKKYRGPGVQGLPAYNAVISKLDRSSGNSANLSIPMTSQTIKGYKLEDGVTEGYINPDGAFAWHLDIEVSAAQIAVNYKICYWDNNGNKIAADEYKGGIAGEQTEAIDANNAKQIPGYKYVSNDGQKTIEKNGQTVVNVYYEPDVNAKASVQYTTESGGFVNPDATYQIQAATGKIIEKGKLTNKDLPRSIATPKAGYVFDGWYRINKNEEKKVSEDEELTTAEATDNLNKDSNTGLYESTVYHAKFKKAQNLSYTVEYHWNGTEIPGVESDTVGGQTFGDTVTVTPKTIDGYTLEPNQSLKIEIGTGDNVLILNYYKNVELTANSDTVTYDGNEHSVSGFTGAPNGVTFVGITEPSAAGTDVGTYWAEFEKDKDKPGYPLNKVDTTGKYIVTAANPGTLTITPVTDEVVVKIAGKTKTETYNGKEHSVEGYTVTSISNPLYTANDFTFTGTAEAKGTNAGTYPMGLTADQFTNNKSKNFSKVTFEVADGWLKIDPVETEVFVKIAGKTKTETYNGKEHSVEGYTVTSISNPLYTANDFTFTGTAEAKGTNAGTYPMGLTADQFTNNKSKNFSKVTFEVADGWLKINPVETEVVVTITGRTLETTYDGKEHDVFGFDATVSNALYNPKEDMWFDGADADMIAKGTDADTYPMGLEVSDFKNKSDNFTNVEFIVTDGYVKINPRSVTLTSASDEKVYDGKPLMNETVAVGGDGFADGEGVTYDFTGSQTDVGESENAFTFEVNEDTKKENYTFEVAIGKLKVNPVTDKVTVTVTEKSGTAMYDGKEHIVSGYESMTADNPLYDEDSVEENPTVMWAAKGTNVGEYPVGIVAGDFKNTNANFTNVEFVVVDGALEITPAPVTLQAPIASKTYDGEPLKAEDYVHSYVEGVNFADDFAAVILTGSQTLVGSSSSLITEVIPKEGKKLKNYKFTFLPGTLTVTDGTGDDPVKPENVVTKTHLKTDLGYNRGDKVTFTISVTNIYNEQKEVTLEEQPGVTFVDPQGAAIGTKATKTLEPGEKWEIQATYTITSNDILAGVFRNTVTAIFGNKSWKTTDTVTTAELDTTLNVTKTSDVPDGQKAALGQTITYTIKVQNAGNVPYTNVKVEDPLTGLKETIETLPVGKTETFTTEYVVTEADVLEGHVLNTATATGDEIKDPKSDEPKEPNGGDEVETPTFAPITIKPKDVTATYNGAAITGKDVEITSGKLLEGHKLSAAVIGSGVNAGSYELTLDPEKIKIVDENNNDVSEMYARTILPGKLIINKRSVLITSQSATKTYDGSALTRPAVTITGDGFVPGELAKAEATGSITKVGSTPNAIRYTTTGAFNAANYSIALSVGTLTVTEKPKPEPRRTFNLTISYVYQNGKRAAASYNRGGLKNGETFDITSPVIAGYTASETVVSGTIYNRDIKVTVIYTADGVNLDDYGVPLGLGNITMNVGDCFE